MGRDGFSKRISDADHTSNHGTSCEYAHPYFMKEHPYLLLSIKQKRGEKVQQHIKTDIDSIETISKLLQEVNSVKDKNKMLDSKFVAMKHENECLWRELAVIRQKHMKQQRILNQLIQFLVTLRQPGSNNTLCREVKNNVRYVLPIMHHKPSEKTNSSESFTNPKYKPSTSFGPVIHELDAADILDSNDIDQNHGSILKEDIESEGVVLSPSSVSQMLKSPDDSTVEEVFAPNEIIMNSPFEELIREVSISPTEELLKPNLTTDSSKDQKLKITKQTNYAPKKRTRKDNYPKKKQKFTLVDNGDNLKPINSPLSYIKIEPQEKDLPVISIPDMDIIEPEVCILNNDSLLNNETTSSSDNMQLANPEPRQVLKCAESSFMQPNLSPPPSLLSGIEYNKDLEKDSVVKQIDTIQGDLDNLLKGLNDKYTFDANMFLNFINDDPTNLNLPMTSEEQVLNDAKNGLNVTPDNQIVSCLSPNSYDLNDLMTASADWTIPNTPISFDAINENDVLNTPVNDSLLDSESIFPNSSPNSEKK
ncbi:heat shock factor protein isoform X2 [Sipha flava]|uniref:Heat shock factor protein isoform X2 n=1 Tax=Sipha flava TaxID=143950 RepID=A0A8B8FD13_9HEMI|nr:heat shock factor protein isoform X2 [Sipha flava]